MPRSKVSKTGSKPRQKKNESATSLAHPCEAKSQIEGSHLPLAGPTAPPLTEINGKPSSAPALTQAGSGPAQLPGAHAAELAEKVKELVRLAQEQGYLTYGDINDAL